MDINIIKEKLSKLIELKNRAATEGEMLAAAAAIQRICFLYKIEEAEISGFDTPNKEAYERNTIDLGVGSYYQFQFRVDLLRVIADFNFCKVIMIGINKEKLKEMPNAKFINELFKQKSKGKVFLIGQPSNVKLVQYFYQYLNTEIRHLTRNLWKVARSLNPDFNETKWKRSFKIGIIKALEQRLAAQRQQDIQTNTNAHALVVQFDKELNNAINELIENLKKGKDKKNEIYIGAFETGKEVGKNLKLQNEFEREGRTALPA